MSKPDVWMPLYIGDYLADTTHLSTTLHGAYILLLLTSWMRGGQLPDNDEALEAITKMDPEAWAKAKPVIREFFEISEGCWKQKRLVSEYARAKHVSEVNRENGKKGGRPPKDKRDGTEQVTEPITGTKANGKADSKRNETPSQSQPPTTLQEPTAQLHPSGAQADLSTNHGAAAGLIFPSNLSSAQQDAARTLLNGHSSAQLMLDELTGFMEKKNVRDPMALLLAFMRKAKEGTFVPSHAHRIEVEREGTRAAAELRTAEAAGRA